MHCYVIVSQYLELQQSGDHDSPDSNLSAMESIIKQETRETIEINTFMEPIFQL